MISLDARLKCIYDAVGYCDCIADIGSDHARLLIALMQSKRIKRAIACDINEGPLERSRKNAAAHNITEIEFYLSDGFDSILHCSFDKASICGMGGILISEIIRRGGEKAHCGLILQPMTAHSELRAFLWNNGYSISCESFAVESGKPYVVISAHYSGIKESYRYSDLYLGKIRPETPEFKAYCKKVSAQARMRLKGAMLTGGMTKNLSELIEQCRYYTDIII